ncbi:MAG: diacylglycerol kinase family lipid kinase [Paludibacteraceae bacterium]|nr:diacylglycerol kinase family lipid kinase [Paludibacteraceae bacterium]
MKSGILYKEGSVLTVLTNPTSGKRRYRKQQRALAAALESRGIRYRVVATLYAGHAIELARQAVEAGSECVLVVGGDGTLSEAVNGVMTARVPEEQRRRVSLGLIPCGTGNDWGRYWQLTRDGEKAIARFLDGEEHPIDVGCVTYLRNGEAHRRYFINSVGFGVDSMCCARAEVLKYYMGSHALNYFIALLMSLRHQQPIAARISADGQTVTDSAMFTMNIGNGPFSGGGIRQNPQADPSDGVFHAMCANRPTLSQVRKAIPRLFDGRLLEMDFIHSFTGQEVEVQVADDAHLRIEADGIVSHFSGSCRVTCLHHALNMYL